MRKRILLRKLCIYGLPVALIALVIWGANQLWPRVAAPAALEDPAYTLKTISVETDGTVPRERILEIAGIREGQNLFEADLKTIHERLMSHAQFRDAGVRRELPDKLSISVSERRPVALVAPTRQELAKIAEIAPSARWMIDATGMLLELDESLAEFHMLPCILVREDPGLEVGRQVRRKEVQQAIALIEMVNGRMEAGFYRIVLVDTFRGYALDAVGEHGTRVTFGRTQLKEQVARLASYLEFTDDIGQKLTSINLMVERNTPALYGEPQDPPLRPIRRVGVTPPAGVEEDVLSPDPPEVEPPAPEVRRALPASEGSQNPPNTTSPFQQATSAAESFTDGER